MRVYIISADQVTISGELPGELREGEIAVASVAELDAARLGSKRLLSLWNGLPGADRLTRIGDREAFLGRLWAALEDLPDPEPAAGRSSKQAEVIAMLRRPEGATVAEVMAATGWQPHTVRGVVSGALKKKLGLAIASGKEERGRVYRIVAPAG